MARRVMYVSPNIDIYDEEFNRYLKIAKNLVAQIKRKQDRKICMKWITKLCNMRSNDMMVKKNRNTFFRYMLNVLHRAVDDRMPEHQGYPQYSDKHGEVGGDREQTGAGDKSFKSKWSQDKRTYVAIKPIPGRGALVFMAVTKCPELGWDYHR